MRPNGLLLDLLNQGETNMDLQPDRQQDSNLIMSVGYLMTPALFTRSPKPIYH